MSEYRGRFAPSPTGDLHLGSLATALIAAARARAAGGRLLLRVEDIDTARVVAGSEGRQRDDLRWLGLDWDEGPDVGGPSGPYRQSERAAYYEEALARLAGQGLLYLCDCSRAEIAQVASAPHAGDEGPRYPGTCRRFGMGVRQWKRPPAVRVMLPDREVAVDDALQGRLVQHVAGEVGDFVLKRGDGVYAYQLAVVVDDIEMGITEVVRGVDLLASAPRQALLAELLGGRPPAWAHVPLVVGTDGARLQKREASETLADSRQRGLTPADVVARLTRTLGLTDLDDLAPLRGVREVRLAAESGV
jgi:glutamyl-tRNA synthetase